ncbi:MAG: hypothetical protein ACP5JF_05260 [Candidatus Methanodesulfokora sp.]
MKPNLKEKLEAPDFSQERTSHRGVASHMGIIPWLILPQLISILLVMLTSPSPELSMTMGESVGLSSLYVMLAFVSSIVIMHLIRRRVERILRILIALTIAYSSIFSLLYIIPSPVSIPAGALLAYLAMRHGFIGKAAKCILSSVLSYFFVAFFPKIFISFFLLFLAIFDAYSVLKGPLSSIFELHAEKLLKPLFIEHGNMAVGLGDLFSYSLAASSSALSEPFPLFIMPVLFLNIGIVATIAILHKVKRPLPGLTIPIVLWLAGEVIISFRI